MKLKDKLKVTARRSIISYLIAALAIVYFLMTLVKGVYFSSKGSDFPLIQMLHNSTDWLIRSTWVIGIDYIWEIVPALRIDTLDLIDVFQVVIPPFVVFMICSLFIADHQNLRAKYWSLKSDVEREIALRDVRKDAGIETISENATLDVVISNATNNDPAWHNTGWGKVLIGVAVALIIAVFGIK